MLAPILLGLCLLAGVISWVFSHWFSGHLVSLFYGLHRADPDSAGVATCLERAETLRLAGQGLAAIEVLRECLTRHRCDLHAGLRIAEIYEEDLRNPLAAAFEYEEMLTWRMPEERWGQLCLCAAKLWSARLHQPQRALALLERLARTAPHTKAGRAAVQRLALVRRSE